MIIYLIIYLLYLLFKFYFYYYTIITKFITKRNHFFLLAFLSHPPVSLFPITLSSSSSSPHQTSFPRRHHRPTKVSEASLARCLAVLAQLRWRMALETRRVVARNPSTQPPSRHFRPPHCSATLLLARIHPGRPQQLRSMLVEAGIALAKFELN